MAEHKMEQKLKDMGWNLTLCEERDRQKFNEMPELRFLSSIFKMNFYHLIACASEATNNFLIHFHCLAHRFDPFGNID